eukprot:scaffold4969_cov364-Prasinococcus_capsulatus_cf.AAC.3
MVPPDPYSAAPFLAVRRLGQRHQRPQRQQCSRRCVCRDRETASEGLDVPRMRLLLHTRKDLDENSSFAVMSLRLSASLRQCNEQQALAQSARACHKSGQRPVMLLS